MANIKWSGIEQKKYGLTARWYVSAYYGNDIDIDGVGLFDPSTNVNGHGGKTRPFASADKLFQQSVGVAVFDSGVYKSGITFNLFKLVGDGNVKLTLNSNARPFFMNVTLESGTVGTNPEFYDCKVLYSKGNLGRTFLSYRTVYVECTFYGIQDATKIYENNIFIRCSGTLYYTFQSLKFTNNIIINCPSLIFEIVSERPVSTILDYSIIIGTVRTSIPINGKTTGVTIEDFKANGNYFGKSYSEVDLFGNVLGNGASVPQLQTLFCNYISPVYLDNYNELNLHLKTTAPDILKYGGLNGTFIGALPIMHWFDAENLWDNYRDAVNTVDLEKDSATKAIKIAGVAETGTFRSTRIDLPKPITANLANFYANLVYNIEGTVKQGVSNQRIDTTPDLLPDNTANQRAVYDFKLAIAPNDVDSLGAFKNYEIDRSPAVDAEGDSNMDDLFNPLTETKQTIQSFMIEFTMRKIIID